MKRITGGGLIIVLLVVAGMVNWTYRDVWGRADIGAGTQVPPTNPVAHVALPNSGKDCGPMSLWLVCSATGKKKSIAELRELTNSTESGTSMLDLKNAAASLGFQVEARQLPFRGLCQHLASPDGYAILHVGSTHFVAAFGVAENSIRIADAARGVRDVREAVLLAAPYKWDGTALLLTAEHAPGGSS